MRLALIPLIELSLILSKVTASAPLAPPRVAVPRVAFLLVAPTPFCTKKSSERIHARSVTLVEDGDVVFDNSLLLVNRSGLCAMRRCETQDLRTRVQPLHNTHSFAQCHDAMCVCMCDNKCLHDAQRCVGAQAGNLQLAADSATSFTSLPRFYSHTCVNQSRVQYTLARQESCRL